VRAPTLARHFTLTHNATRNANSDFYHRHAHFDLCAASSKLSRKSGKMRRPTSQSASYTNSVTSGFSARKLSDTKDRLHPPPFSLTCQGLVKCHICLFPQDENPTRNTPYINYALLAANALIFHLRITLPLSRPSRLATRTATVSLAVFFLGGFNIFDPPPPPPHPPENTPTPRGTQKRNGGMEGRVGCFFVFCGGGVGGAPLCFLFYMFFLWLRPTGTPKICSPDKAPPPGPPALVFSPRPFSPPPPAKQAQLF